MRIEADGFAFDFTDALDAFVFDEKNRVAPHFHGLSHAMKAVDLIVELQNDYLFVEVKDFHAPDDYDFNGAVNEDQRKQRLEYFNHLRETLKYKYRDSWLYRWAENKTDKSIRYLCLLTLDNALVSRMHKELNQQLPLAQTGPRWTREMAKSATVVNLERWNKNFPAWPVAKI
ncbi:hypothetical protein [Methylomonas sp. YC3]